MHVDTKILSVIVLSLFVTLLNRLFYYKNKIHERTHMCRHWHLNFPTYLHGESTAFLHQLTHTFIDQSIISVKPISPPFSAFARLFLWNYYILFIKINGFSSHFSIDTIFMLISLNFCHTRSLTMIHKHHKTYLRCENDNHFWVLL